MLQSFENEGTTYEMKMTRAGVRAAEAQGLSVSEISEKPFSAIYLMFFASLYHLRVSPQKATAMLDTLLDSGLVKFGDLYAELSEAYTGLFDLGESKTE